MDFTVKKEQLDNIAAFQRAQENNAAAKSPVPVIELSTSSSGSDSDSDGEEIGNSGEVRVSSDSRKKRKLDELGVVVPVGFLAPLPPPPPDSASASAPAESFQPKGNGKGNVSSDRRNKQFWKAGDYEGSSCSDWDLASAGMDHVRVHPKFLHSNATSHKWALGAFAELLDNALDEACNGATYVNIDMLESRKDGSRMLLIEDNGGGMDPDKMRKCMSLGYSAKSKVANTIGQYGNGFKTSTMRLGADVLVFSRCRGKDGNSATQSIGLLSYTFLTSTGKEDIVVPMLDFEKEGREWVKMTRFSTHDWNRNVETIVQWSPFSDEVELLRQDIQLRGVNREEKNIQMASAYPNSRHFLTYRHSLRTYASILYLRIPPGFRIILRGKDVDHHSIVNDMMLSQERTYRPQGGDGILKDSNVITRLPCPCYLEQQMEAVVTIGFVKDAKHHIDVQGFNVYHKSRLIKPFWRLWCAAGSGGRGVIGVLEANFVEPAHDKQGFERTTVLARLESRLLQMQKNYWLAIFYDETPKVNPNLVIIIELSRHTYCHKIGYAPTRNKKALGESSDREDFTPGGNADKFSSYTSLSGGKGSDKFARNGSFGHGSNAGTKAGGASEAYLRTIIKLKEENRELKNRLEAMEAETRANSMQSMNCEKCKSLETQLQEAQMKIEELNKEQESLITIFSEERDRRDEEEENSRKKSKEASNTIQQLLEKVRILEKMKTSNYRSGR